MRTFPRPQTTVARPPAPERRGRTLSVALPLLLVLGTYLALAGPAFVTAEDQASGAVPRPALVDFRPADPVRAGEALPSAVDRDPPAVVRIPAGLRPTPVLFDDPTLVVDVHRVLEQMGRVG